MADSSYTPAYDWQKNIITGALGQIRELLAATTTIVVRAYSALGDVGKARKDINKALSLNPPEGDELSLQAIRKALEKQP